MIPSAVAPVLALWLAAAPPAAPGTPPAAPAATSLPSEIPESFRPTNHGFDHERREVEIPMRDGVKLHTVILLPRGAKGAPILLTRTPYSADALTSHAASVHLAAVLQGYDNVTDVVVEGGYVRVVQDVRGKYRSEGDYVMTRPLRGALNPTAVDHATDTWDTIDWLVRNVPESNGKVGILGISYDGFLPLMALVDPHPALKVAVPMNPMVDGWKGDDWFHNGAFRLVNMPYVYAQEATRGSEVKWYSTHRDDYDAYLSAGSAGDLGRQRGMEQLGFWRKLLEHPAYDAFWQEQAMDRVLGARPIAVPVMIVHGLWDQEDIHGPIDLYRALARREDARGRLFLVMGPWSHGQQIRDGSSLGAIRFRQDTALQFRRDVLRPFLDEHLKDGAPPSGVAPVTAFVTGANAWRRLPAWPAGCEAGCSIRPTPLHLRDGGRAGFEPPAAGDAPSTEWISDPAKPVPYRSRPIRPTEDDGQEGWSRWLVDDQRDAASRTDVVTFVSPPLTAPLHVAGSPIVNLVASTTGTDADWVVKLVDVHPDEVPSDPAMGGYQLMVAADVFRGRYREDLARAAPIPAGKALPYRFALPTVNHVFLPGHRIMVQVQSSWFPLYDRNPQTFVENVFRARPEDYRKATHRVHHAPGAASQVELPIVRTP